MGHSRSLPLRLKWMGAILFGLAIAGPASAQVQVRIEFGRPQAYGFSNNYPWFNDVPQYQNVQSFQYFLAYHPDIARALSRNPGALQCRLALGQPRLGGLPRLTSIRMGGT